MVDPTEPTPIIAMVCFIDKPFKKKSRTKAGLSHINKFYCSMRCSLTSVSANITPARPIAM